MKLRTSFFNGTILKKDLTRFLPLWVCYLILGLLLAVSNFGNVYYSYARTFGGSLSLMAPVMCVYALVAAQLLFGDLYQGRMCNAIHALPVRREGLFFTHFTAGLMMGILPNIPIALVAMLGMGRLWYVAPIWLGGTALVYLLFFGLAVLCMLCSGNRFAAVALYGLVNLLGVMVMWVFETFYLPMLYGMQMTEATRKIFYFFSPAFHMMQSQWLTMVHSPDCWGGLAHKQWQDCIYNAQFDGALWVYLGIVAVLGLGFAATALVLYRKRHLECAGDFLSVKSVGLLFTLVASTLTGCVCYYIVGEAYLGLAVGLVVGFFICRMLLERTIKVFGWKSWVQLTAFVLAVSLSFGLTWFDVFGVARRIPKTEQIAAVTIADRYLGEWRLEQLQQDESSSGVVTVGVDPSYVYGKEGMLTLTEAKDIETVRDIHRLLLEEGDASLHNQYTETITIHYQLKNGTTLTRYYYTASDSSAMKLLQAYVSTPEFILGFATREEMVKCVKTVSTHYRQEIYMKESQWLEKLVNAMFDDAEAGRFGKAYDDYACDLYLSLYYGPGEHGDLSLQIPKSATYTLSCLNEYLAWQQENTPAA